MTYRYELRVRGADMVAYPSFAAASDAVATSVHHSEPWELVRRSDQPGVGIDVMFGAGPDLVHGHGVVHHHEGRPFTL